MHQAQVDLEQQRLAESQLRSPIAGMVITAKVQDKAGSMLKPGDPFCEIVEADRMAVEMSVPEKDLALVQPGKKVVVKLNAYPDDDVRRRGGAHRSANPSRGGRTIFSGARGFCKPQPIGAIGDGRAGANPRGRRLVSEWLVSGGLHDVALAVSMGLAESVGPDAVKMRCDVKEEK